MAIMDDISLIIAIDAREISGNFAGKGRYARELVTGLMHRPHVHLILYCRDTPNFPLTPSVTVVLVERLGRRVQWQMTRDAKRRGAQVFFAPTAYLPVLFSVLPTVLTIHDLAIFVDRRSRPATRTWLAERWLLPLAVRRAKHIVVDSQSTARDLTRLLHVSHITVTPLGYNAKQFTATAHTTDKAVIKKYRLPPNFFLFIGTLEPRKNIVGLIESYGDLPSNIQRDHPLVIGGKEGWYYEAIFATVRRRHLEKAIYFLGRAADADLAPLYRQCLGFVFPSFYEGFGLPVLEAMACGAPTITSNVSSLPEVVGECGLLVSPNNRPALTQALMRLATDSDLRQKLHQQSPRQAQTFTWPKTVAATLTILAQVASPKRT